MSLGTIPADNPNVYRVPRPTPVNVELLEASLQAAFGAALWSVNEHGNSIDVGFLAPPTAQQIDAADAVFAAHNPAGQTPAQIKKAARDAARASLPAYYAEPNPSANATRDAVKALILALGLDEQETS